MGLGSIPGRGTKILQVAWPGQKKKKKIYKVLKNFTSDFSGGIVVKNLPANAGDTGSSPGPGRSHMPRSN